MTLAANIKKAREIKGLSQVQLAKLVGVSQTTISEIENGKSADIGYRVLFGLADALGVEALSLTQDDAPTPTQRLSFHDEESVLLLYRRLSPEMRTLLKAIAQSMIDMSPQSSKANTG